MQFEAMLSGLVIGRSIMWI